MSTSNTASRAALRQGAPPAPRENDPESVARYLLSFDWELQNKEVFRYLVDAGLPLWLEILHNVPQPAARGRLLELGSPPFHITLLVEKFRNYDMTLTAAAADGRPKLEQEVASAPYGERRNFECTCFDLERDRFPFPDASFDVVMWCEVIEHLTENPVFTLSEIHRVLRPGGTLVLSTPNVARAENIVRLLLGKNVFDPYHLGAPLRGSRHSREYTLPELTTLLRDCGFDIRSAVSRNIAVWPNTWHGFAARLARALAQLAPGEHGDHLFVRAVKNRPFRWNFPADIFDQGHLVWYWRVQDREVTMGVNDLPHTGPGWGPLTTGLEGKAVRRAGAVADAWLAPEPQGRSVSLELSGVAGTSAVDLEVWQGQGEQARWLAAGHADAPAGRWTRLAVALNDAVGPEEPLHLRILAPDGAYVHRMKAESVKLKA